MPFWNLVRELDRTTLLAFEANRTLVSIALLGVEFVVRYITVFMSILVFLFHAITAMCTSELSDSPDAELSVATLTKNANRTTGLLENVKGHVLGGFG